MTRGSRVVVRWWRAPSDYVTAVQYTRAIGLRRPLELLIGTGSFVYGLAAALSAVYFGSGTGVAFSVPIALGVAATSTLIGAQWLRGVEISERWSLAFLFYSDLSVIVVVLCYADAFTAWPGLALLAANGIYAAFQHDAPAVTVHFVISVGAMIWCAVASLLDGTDPVLVAIRGLVLVPIVTAVPLVVLPGVRMLNADAIGARRDSLTGLLNRRGLVAIASEHVRGGGPVSLLVLDIEKFKAINDAFGHVRGDEVLAQIGAALGSAVPSDAVAARIGGEEFGILLPGDDAHEVAARIHDCTLACPAGVAITVSIGIASTPRLESPDALTALLDRADAAMYRAKADGGRRTAVG
ncbi:diguanylate cyclase [Williamsia sp. MIQD14]|uniref:GGDEF domain-containing protein n=1 Tax=Williamsia sp. MIQD14 TaxID=3425703 RepID=UPI003D9FF8C4